MNLPEEFEKEMIATLGEEEYARLRDALQKESPVSLRINVSKAPAGLEEQPPLATARRVPWSDTGYYLDRRLTFTFDPLFHAGCYYVQEASSMFVERVLRTYVTSPVVMLDLCAAPGGKSTLCRSALPQGSLLVCNELIRTRAQVLAENLIKWGHPEVIVTQNAPADFAAYPSLFDVILADVPCSGEGMFRKDPTAIDEWSPRNVETCWTRQREILSDVWDALKPGGLFIYSTCTYNIYEDERNVEWIVDHFGVEPLSVPVEEKWNITGNLCGADIPVYHFLPHRTEGEGFFLAAFRKPLDAEVPSGGAKERKKNKDKRGGTKAVPVSPDCKRCLLHPADYQWETVGDTVVAFPTRHADIYQMLRERLHVIHAGITVAQLKGKDCIPHHSLAMSANFNRAQYPQAEVSYDQAVAYLRKEAIAFPNDVPRGYVLVTYRGVPLGFAKNIGNRANNLYPQEWRIRSGYLPEEILCLYNQPDADLK